MARSRLAPVSTSSKTLMPSNGKGNMRGLLADMLHRWEQKEGGGDEQLDETSHPLENKIINLTAWRSERQLRSLCFFTPERGKVLTPLEYVSQDGKTKIHISPNVSYGLPNVWDADILDFIISKGREQVNSEKEFPATVIFTASECLKALGKHSRSGKNYQLVRESFQRLSSAWIRYTAMGNYEREKGDTLLGYDVIPKGKFELYEVTLHSWFLRSIRSGNILATDPAIARLLISEDRSGLKKLLLRLISVRLGKQEKLVFWQETLMELCQYKRPSRKFRAELKALSLPWPFDATKEAGRWKIVFYPLPTGDQRG